ncbi:hypothetical protein FA15DRAFT_711921 [Coprinopsis marcescibilis]|uniref:Uncharacterized protein n=1 Tax=Coprinopsis marcescibilis TaxID=230819 RepID=A0A5C3K8G4_COPMA|nr:hypothetical protein FA15DRAFT_711921 [Coprinopsis marcescibilis]
MVNEIPNAYIAVTDATVPREVRHQAIAGYMVHSSGRLVTKAKFAAGRVTAPDAELYALRAAIIRMIQFDDCNMIVIFTDHIAAAKRAVDPSVHSGQGHSLAVCAQLSKWFSGGPERSIEFVQVPSKLGWHIHLAAHDYVRDTPAVSGRRLETSLDSVRQAVAKSCIDSWISEFQHASYRGKHFLQMGDMRDRPLKPSTLKGGTWLSFTASESIATTARMARCILGHAPLGEYRARFNINGEIQCRCGTFIETCAHLFGRCSFTQHGKTDSPRRLGELMDFLRANPRTFAFEAPSEGIG